MHLTDMGLDLGPIATALLEVVDAGWTELERRHQRALDRRCGTCDERWPCRTYRLATSGR